LKLQILSYFADFGQWRPFTAENPRKIWPTTDNQQPTTNHVFLR